MLPNTVVSFMAAIGASAWLYNKVYHSSGSNNKSALTVGGVAFLLIFIVMMLLTSALFKK